MMWIEAAHRMQPAGIIAANQTCTCSLNNNNSSSSSNNKKNKYYYWVYNPENSFWDVGQVADF